MDTLFGAGECPDTIPGIGAKSFKTTTDPTTLHIVLWLDF
jgi:hypothetical protein